MPVLTTAQVATLQRVLATTNNVFPRIETLQAWAQINPAIASRVADLSTQRDYLAQLATAALEIERQLGGQVSIPPPPPPSSLSYSPPPPPPAPSYSPPSSYSPPPAPMGYSPPPSGTGMLPPVAQPLLRQAWSHAPESAEIDLAQRQGYHFEQDQFGGWWRVPNG